MRFRSLIAFLLVSFFALGCQPSGLESKLVADESETFNGRPVSEWVEQLRRGPVAELTRASEDAMPVWLAAARDDKAANWVRHTFTLHFDDQGWTGPVYMAMLDLQGLNQSFALSELAGNRAACRQVASPLMDKIRQWQSSDGDTEERLVQTAVRGIRKLRPAPDGTIKLVTDLWPTTKNQLIVRSDLMEILGGAGSPGVDAVVNLCLQNDDAINELWHFLMVADQQTFAAIIEASESENVRHRRIATLMIDRAAGREKISDYHALLADAAIPRLQDPDPQVQKYALSAIRDLAAQPSAAQAIPILAKWMLGDSSTSRIATGKALVAFGDAGLPAIRAAAQSDTPDARVAACSALASVTPLSAEDTDLLLELAEDSHPHVRRYAVFALGKCDVHDPRIVMAIVAAMSDPQTRDWATRALGSLGSLAEEAIPALKQQLDSEDLRVRLQAADALWQVSHDVDLVLPVAREIAADDQGITTGGYGVSYHYVEGKRTERRKHYQDPLSVRAANLLGDMGPHAKPAVGELIALLASSNASVRSVSARALGKIGPAAIAAVPALQKLIQADPNQQLVDILHQIDPNAAVDRDNSSGE